MIWRNVRTNKRMDKPSEWICWIDFIMATAASRPRVGLYMHYNMGRWTFSHGQITPESLKNITYTTHFCLTGQLFMPPPNVVWPGVGGYCFCPVLRCVRASVSVCASPKTLLTRYLAEYLTHFHQTYINDALRDRGERVTVWCQKVKGQGHSKIMYWR